MKGNDKILKTNRNKTYVYVRFLFFIFLMFLVFILSSFKIGYNKNNFDTKDTIYVYDTVVYYDTTVVYDTVYLPYDNSGSLLNDSLLRKNKKSRIGNIISKDPDYFLIIKTPAVNRKKFNFFSLDFLVSPFYNNQLFKSDLIYQENSDVNNRAVNPYVGFSLTSHLNYFRHNYVFTSGIQFTDFRINFSALSAKYLIDTIPKIHFEQKTEMHIDSIALINIDTLIATGDTVYYYFKDTTYYTSVDTIYKLEADTSINYFSQKNINSLKYVEIPLFIGKTFYTRSFNFTPQIGIITSFFVNSKGKIVSLTNLYQTDDINNKIKFADINLSLYLGMTLNYYISDRFDFITSAYYRRNINSIYRNYPLLSRFNSYGINIGVRYKLFF